MSPNDKRPAEQDPLAFLAGGGEMGERTRNHDWSATPVGPVAGWPQSLKTAVSICLGSRYPIVLWWGNPSFTTFYNDAYIPALGVTKHPGWLGRSGRACWSDIWHVIGPMLESVFVTGEATWSEDLLLIMERNVPLEETYFTFSYNPLRDDAGAVGGIFCACNETTGRVIGERRLRTLRDLGRTVADAKTVAEACEVAARALAANPADVPFALIYLLEDDGRRATLVCLTGVDRDTPASPAAVDLEDAGAPWPFRQAAETGAAVEVGDLPARFGPLPGGAWPESPRRAVVLPLARPGQTRPAGFLVAGLSPRRVVDADYRSFLDLIAGHIATAIANARAHEQERKRAEALAELDRAKTVFFSNVSHEFRTPLTLMLGPVEDLLARRASELSSAAAGQLEVAHRNGLRLLRLVNTLLEFSRIEAGRVRAVYQPTDLAAFTAELASVFRSACERAGLRLVVDCPPLAQPVYVDRDMWEKVVLNLLSNAFKFTFEGEIEVRLQIADCRLQIENPQSAICNLQSAILTVRDTGTGIPAAEMPRLFERFHRIENARGRTHEGSGIGLALVQELVKLHGGSVAAESVPGQGTTFTVTVPLGSAHLPPDRVGTGQDAAALPTGAAPYVEEALRWLPDDRRPEDEAVGILPGHYELPPVAGPLSEQNGGRPRVLVADDNADMRQYLVRLLAGRYAVQATADGEAALAAARARPPDLVLADVMMPRLDGFGLLRGLRADPRTRDLPVLLLSARAGEESRVDGMEAGADDYLVKPFSARELLARVSAYLQMARLRREAGESLRQYAEALREADHKKDEFLATLAHELRNPLAPLRNGLQIMRLASHSHEAVEQARTMMERQLGQMVRLIDDLLDMSRVSQGKIELRRERVELATVLQQAVENSRPLIDAGGHDLTIDVPPEPLFVDADVTRLAQVFANLLNNAAKYTERGGRITLAVARQADGVVVTVRDTGVGIPADMLPKVFELFTQVEHSLERSRGGLGIGLSLVKRLVEMHGGSVEAHSEGDGTGSEFVVRLPVAPAGPERAEDALPGAAGAGHRRILVVDDNRDAAVSLATVLRIMGNERQTAHDGLEALEVAATFRPDVVLLDIGMPKLNGYDAARRLRQQPWGRDVVLVALTGWGQDEDRRRAREAGFNFHLVKPFDPAALEKLLAGSPVETG